MKQYIVDAFAENVFEGNTASVCEMDKQLDYSLMQKIAIEKNLSETTSIVWENDYYNLIWFIRGKEVDLFGSVTQVQRLFSLIFTSLIREALSSIH